MTDVLVVQELLVHVEDSPLHAHYERAITLPKGMPLPREGEWINVLDGAVELEDEGPIGILDDLCWSHDYRWVKQDLRLPMSETSFLDRPWRAVLAGLGWTPCQMDCQTETVAGDRE